ncbi:hypothetical protein D3C86_1156280 [compost metagenome]
MSIAVSPLVLISKCASLTFFEDFKTIFIFFQEFDGLNMASAKVSPLADFKRTIAFEPFAKTLKSYFSLAFKAIPSKPELLIFPFEITA